MGLPIDIFGQLVLQSADKQHLETLLFRALIRLLCRLTGIDMNNAYETTRMEEDFNKWHDTLPSGFSARITWPSSIPTSTPEAEVEIEAWYSSDTCALSIIYYHMARMLLLLIHRPTTHLRAWAPVAHSDFFVAYQSLQQDLRRHALHILSIARGKPDDRVRKYMLQPLYVAGRCLTNGDERREVLSFLEEMGVEMGVATAYRTEELVKEWGGMP